MLLLLVLVAIITLFKGATPWLHSLLFPLISNVLAELCPAALLVCSVPGVCRLCSRPYTVSRIHYTRTLLAQSPLPLYSGSIRLGVCLDLSSNLVQPCNPSASEVSPSFLMSHPLPAVTPIYRMLWPSVYFVPFLHLSSPPHFIKTALTCLLVIFQELMPVSLDHMSQTFLHSFAQGTSFLPANSPGPLPSCLLASE